MSLQKTHNVSIFQTALLAICLLFVACNYTLKVKDGRTAFERKQFAVAIPMLEKEQARAKTRKERGQLCYLLGDAYRRSVEYWENHANWRA